MGDDALQDDVAENTAVFRTAHDLRVAAQKDLKERHRAEAAAKLRDATGRIQKETGDTEVSKEGSEFLRRGGKDKKLSLTGNFHPFSTN